MSFRWTDASRQQAKFRRRELAVVQFRRMRTLQQFASVLASVLTHFNQERSLSSRQDFKANRIAALAEWRDLCTE